MLTLTQQHQPPPLTEVNWDELYSSLTPQVTYWVIGSNIPVWFRQQPDLISDIVQEAIIRTFIRVQHGNTGLQSPVASIHKISIRIAHNYFIDLIRKDKRMLHITHIGRDEDEDRARIILDEWIEVSEQASEDVYLIELYDLIAWEIAHFSPKMRLSMLRDLADRMYFEDEPTPLQQCFLHQGINLEEYCHQVPLHPSEKSRHTSLVSLGYKTLGSLPSIREYIAA